MNSIKKITNYVFDRYKVIDRVAFFINEEYIFDHYQNVMIEMENDKFDIILANKFKSSSYDNILYGLKNNSWNVRFLDDVIFINKYRVLVTHLYLGGEDTLKGTVATRLIIFLLKSMNKVLSVIKINKYFSTNEQYFQNILGQYNIRFMYGADAGENSFTEYGNNYNNLFDMFFCHGPRDGEMVKKIFNKPVYQMGYPRYDNFFRKKDDTVHKKILQEKYSCKSSKKTILWISTVNKHFSTIESYSPIMKTIAKDYNVIVRPHPLEIDPQYGRFNQKVLDIVNSEMFILNENAYQDMTELYLIADFVMCDYGGSIFSALYMNKKIILLNNENIYKDLVVSTSTSMEVRKYLFSINENETERLVNYLENEAIWKSVDTVKCRKLYFGSLSPHSAKDASNNISKILNSVQAKMH